MIQKKYIEKTLRDHMPLLQEKYRVKRIGIFGSIARGDAVEDSDIDLLVEFLQPIGWEFVDLKQFLEEILKRPVDLVTVNALKPQLKESILNEVIYA